MRPKQRPAESTSANTSCCYSNKESEPMDKLEAVKMTDRFADVGHG